jgi:hypothetical protein
VERLDRLEVEGLRAVEEALAGPEQDRGDVEREFVDHSGGEGLAGRPGSGPAGDETVERDRHVAGGVGHRRPPR